MIAAGLPSTPANPFALATASGHAWPLHAPDAGAVRWLDIATALGNLCRYNGHVRAGFYSVAQHCCLVHDHVAPELRPYGLLHDAHEAFLGDWTSPLLRLLWDRTPGLAAVLQQHRDRHDLAIHTAANLPWPLPPAAAAAIKTADRRAAATEQRDLLAQPLAPMAFARGAPLRIGRIKPWPATKAADEWLTRLEQAGIPARGLEHDYV